MGQGEFDVSGYDPELVDEAVQSVATLGLDRKLIKERQGIQPHNEVVYVWGTEAGLVVADGDHAGFVKLMVRQTLLPIGLRVT